MNALIEYIAKALVDRPDQVELRTGAAAAADGATVFELKVAPEDVGKVIGRDGRTVNAMRSLLTQLAQRKGVKARLEVLDDKKSSGASNNSPPPPSA